VYSDQALDALPTPVAGSVAAMTRRIRISSPCVDTAIKLENPPVAVTPYQGNKD